LDPLLELFTIFAFFFVVVDDDADFGVDFTTSLFRFLPADDDIADESFDGVLIALAAGDTLLPERFVS